MLTVNAGLGPLADTLFVIHRVHMSAIDDNWFHEAGMTTGVHDKC